MTRIAACICSHDRPYYVAKCLESLRAQTIPPDGFDILVVDSASPVHSAARLATLVADIPNARLIRIDTPGVSAARNAAARVAAARLAADYIAYLDDDALADPGWIAAIARAVAIDTPAVVGGRVLPLWEAPLPAWWPTTLRGVLSIIEHDRPGVFRTADLPAGLEPYGVNMVVHIPAMLDAGGFSEALGRVGDRLLSDEDVELAWRIQDRGLPVRYDPAIVVHHQIQASRLNPGWLLRRLALQGMSTVLTRRALGQSRRTWRELPRRAAVAAITWPAYALVPRNSARWLAWRWRHAYARGFVRGVFIGTGR